MNARILILLFSLSLFSVNQATRGA
jgi:hypothetical protein